MKILQLTLIYLKYFNTKYLKLMAKRFEKVFCFSIKCCSVKKGVLKTFARFTGKHLCQSLFFNKYFRRLLLFPVFAILCTRYFINNKPIHQSNISPIVTMLQRNTSNISVYIRRFIKQ